MGCDCKLYDLAQPAMLIDKERNAPIYNALQMSSCREKEVSCKLPLEMDVIPLAGQEGDRA